MYIINKKPADINWAWMLHPNYNMIIESGQTEMNITIFGYPQTGKTGFFLLVSGSAPAAEAADGRREASLRTVHVPDPRLERIAALHPDKKKITASFDLVDLAGISYGEVKNSHLLSHLRKSDGLVHVVRAFRNERVPNQRGRISPAEDIQYMEEELVLADLLSIENRLERLARDLKKIKNPEFEKEHGLLQRIKPCLESGQSLRSLSLSPDEEKTLRSFAFLSLKPLLHVINLDETEASQAGDPAAYFSLPPGKANVLGFCGAIESEIAGLEPEEMASFLKEYGLPGLIRDRFAELVIPFLGLVTFYTIGNDEVRAWTVCRGSPAGRAAGEVHTDMEKGFIRAEVMSWQTLVQHGSLKSAREAGAMRLEGRDYVIQDGDVVYFRFSK